MIIWKVRNNWWKFQVREKSGTHFFRAVSKLSFFRLQIKIFFSKTPNGSIRKVRWFLAIFIFFAFTLVHQASRLSHFSTNFENEVLVDFNDFGWLDMLDIAYSSSSNCSRSLDNQELPELRAHLCKIRPILQKKGENLDFRLFFGFECC